jgi:hypothetical protein
MAEARGEILAYLNSDDLLRPGAVARVVEHFRDRPACDLVYGRDAMIDQCGNYSGMYPTADYSFERLVECCCISQPAAFWRKRLADQVGPFDESLQLVMDYDYWLRADRSGGALEHIPDVLAQTRLHRQTKSSGGGDAAAHHRRYYRELFEVCFRHAGYVSSQYIYKWLFTSVFNVHPWTWRFEPDIVRVVQCWYHFRHRCKLGRRAAIRLTYDAQRPHMRPFLRRLFGTLKPPSLRRAPDRVKLTPDLLIGPELSVRHPGGPARITGIPLRDSVLRVFRGNDELAAVPLRANEVADVCVEIPAAGQVRVTFSESEQLPDGRRVSFKLQGTTLFTERDAA